MTERIPLCRVLRAAIAVFLFSATATATAAAAAAEEAADALARSDIKVSYSEIDGMISDMQGALASAETALDDVKNIDVKDGNAMADGFFLQMKAKVNVMLERLGPNSVLMDNLEGAKANVIVFKRWFERQPADFPNRDQQIVRLEQTLTDYDSLSDQIAMGRQEAQEALTMLSRAIFYRSIDQKVQSVERSVEMTKRVLVSLQGLGAGIRKVAEQDVPQPSPTIPD